MGTISINLTQSVANTMVAPGGSGSTTLGGIVDTFFTIAYGFEATHSTYSSLSTSPSSVRYAFSDGGYAQYFGVSGLATSGSGVANYTSIEEYWPSAYRIAAGGSGSVSYTVNANGGVQTAAVRADYNSVTVQTLLPTYSQYYNTLLGNMVENLSGNVTILPGMLFSGSLNTISLRADKFLDSATANGNFSISGNGVQIGQQLSTTSLTGTLNSYSELYRDGSYYKFAGVSVPVVGKTPIDIGQLAIAANFPDNDTVDIALPLSISIPLTIASGAGNDTITLKGGSGKLGIVAGEGNDLITLKDSGHYVDGGSGTDSVTFPNALGKYAFSKSGSTISVREKAAGTTDVILNTETLQFADLSITPGVRALASSTPSQSVDRVIELYVAFFNRLPDAAGLDYWINQYKGGTSLNSIADSFYSAGVQFSSLTGYSANMTNASFIDVIYKNVLGRPNGADAGGQAYWQDQLTKGLATRGTLAIQILDAAHSYKGDATWGWVANLLDNKVTTARVFAVELGLSYIAQDQSISKGVAMANAVTANGPADVLTLVGLAASDISPPG